MQQKGEQEEMTKSCEKILFTCKQ